MDAIQFDALARAIAAKLSSRRNILRALSGAGLFAIPAASTSGKKNKKKNQKKKKKKKECPQGQVRCGGACQECCSNFDCRVEAFPFCTDGVCVECNIPFHCEQKHGGTHPYCINNTCFKCSEFGPWELILSGGDSPTAPIHADDDWEVYHNGTRLFADNNGVAGASAPVTFEASRSDQVRVVAKDVQGVCQFLSALWLHRTCDGASKKLSDTTERGCNFPPGHKETFFDQTFNVGLF